MKGRLKLYGPPQGRNREKKAMSEKGYYDVLPETYVKCPYCGYEAQDMCDYPHDNTFRFDGDTAEWECSECEKEFRVEMSVECSFRSYVPDPPQTTPSDEEDTP